MYVHDLTTKRYAELAGTIDTVIIPTGSLEAHGQHCPLGTDIFIPERMCKDIEAATHGSGEFLIAPAINYGYTPMLTSFPGTIHLPAETLISIYSEVAVGFVKWGAKNIVFMNGHGGNIPMLTVACDRVAIAGGSALAISWWATYAADILKICGTQGHAGEDETSVILAIDASLVDDASRSIHMQKAFTLPLTGPGQLAARYPAGMSGDSTAATKEKGEKLLEMMLKKNLDYIQRLRTGNFTDPIR
jgi:creatinine amidohydrolase